VVEAGLLFLVLPLILAVGVVYPFAALVHWSVLARRGPGPVAGAVTRWSFVLVIGLTVLGYVAAYAWFMGSAHMPRPLARFLEGGGLLVLVPLLVVDLVVANVFTSERALARHGATRLEDPPLER
jgi:hypothetical protein